ncbi:hypothetical protein DFS33DRAFT_1272213 [Desarmillaria ectypa]|nr:hypothetical protein DFS33DRAFT_1272213 [Desarmillaria ectypa]
MEGPSEIYPQYHPREYERIIVEKRLREEPMVMRRDLVKEKVPGRSHLSPESLMPTTLLERIVDLAHYGQFSTLDDVQRELTYAAIGAAALEICACSYTPVMPAECKERRQCGDLLCQSARYQAS